MKTEYERLIKGLIVILMMIIVITCSCSSIDVLTEHNKYDYYVISYEYPWAEVLVMPDSTTKYVYITDTTTKPGGYLISERKN